MSRKKQNAEFALPFDPSQINEPAANDHHTCKLLVLFDDYRAWAELMRAATAEQFLNKLFLDPFEDAEAAEFVELSMVDGFI